MSADQILSKALSTESEDEAIACLKMARKKGLKLDSSSESNGKHTVESRTKQLQELLDRFNQLRQDYYALKNKFNTQEHDNVAYVSELKKRISWTRKLAVIGLILSIMITATVMHKIYNHRIKVLEAEIQQIELAPCATIFCVMGRALVK
jgi:ribosomal protein L29